MNSLSKKVEAEEDKGERRTLEFWISLEA